MLTVRQFFFLLVLVIGYSQPVLSTDKNEPKETKTSEEKQRPSNISPPAPAKKAEITANKQSDRPQEKFSCPYTNLTSWGRCMFLETISSAEKLFTFWVAVFTLIVAIFTGLIYCEALGRGKKELRAYVSARPNHILGINPAKWRFVIINHGQTPANELTDNAMVDIFPYPLPQAFSFPKLPAQKPSHMVLYPNVDSYNGEAVALRAFTIDELTQCADGTKFRLYIFGVIKYRDIFNQPHTTKFCESLHGGQIRIINNQPVLPQQFVSETANQHCEAD